ncbi:ABC transporter permease [Nonomuraea gerenzanensis]|uniref:Putative ABC transporter integral membrane protein n=1 Tax=Nonomuraea gerenzanensis TaxID=93944 RepID=A0A1M4ENP4_9ACTN|nr:ABC transporter permease [Nonomuraea gerenzanensis]UBU11936.1 FtsX-like permease family protein [Nonomuraea gerenzanensis]SBP00449.1 putative ABC transporter integral membrane protein [Nonomuraea gerenzanensis]
MSAFRAALRLSRRDALRARGRTALVMIMIGLPVLAITALLTLSETTNLTPREELPSRLGSVADAAVHAHTTTLPVKQDPAGRFGHQDPNKTGPPARWTAAEVSRLIGGRVLPFYDYSTDARLPDGADRVDLLEIDLRDPLSTGMRTLADGRLPASPQEIAVTPALLDRGVTVGGTLPLTKRAEPKRVVGVIEDPTRPGVMEVVGLYGSVLAKKTDPQGEGWLVDTPAPVTWKKVRELNQVGLRVASRAVTESPRADRYQYSVTTGDELLWLAIAVLLVVTETVLLAGPAFAVGLRRRRRELATIAAQGGSPGHLRTIVLADGLVLGGVAALLGVALGIGAGAVAESIAARSLDWRSGPVDVPWAQVLGVAALGLVSALVAALAPAITAGRQSPARVLAGRPDEVRDRAARPLFGLVLLVLGAGAAIYLSGRSELLVVAASTVALFGLIALMPWLVRRTGPLAARLPLPARLSVRDATRHRARTVSAVAAVMAATMGAVTVGLAYTSTYAAEKRMNRLEAPEGTLIVTASDVDEATWAKLRAVTQERLPGASPVPAQEAVDGDGRSQAVMLQLASEDCQGSCERYGASYFDVPVGDARLLALLQGRSDPQAAAALAAGRIVVFDPRLVSDGTVSMTLISKGEDSRKGATMRVPAVVARGAQAEQGGAVVPASVLTAAGFTTVERRIYVEPTAVDPALRDQEAVDRFNRELQTVTSFVYAALAEDYTGMKLATLLTAALAAAVVLVLGGTFAATGLAVADMRRDLDTLSAVGGRPLTRRLVVAAQAGYIAGLGAVIGLVAGAITGSALSVSMASMWREGSPIVVPWAFLATLVLGLPLLAALISGLFTRTRMELARRVA